MRDAPPIPVLPLNPDVLSNYAIPSLSQFAMSGRAPVTGDYIDEPEASQFIATVRSLHHRR